MSNQTGQSATDSPIRERPILFSSPMVRAILAGQKTVTRRIVTSRVFGAELAGAAYMGLIEQAIPVLAQFDKGRVFEQIRCPYGGLGDRLWVRETHYAEKHHAPDDYPAIHYAADMEERQHDGRSISPPHDRPSTHAGPWTPSIHMRRAFSRILLEITSVRVERLQGITEAEAKAEGVTPFLRDQEGGDIWSDGTHRTAFNFLWNEINGWSPNSFDSNPWVWVVGFKRLEPS